MGNPRAASAGAAATWPGTRDTGHPPPAARSRPPLLARSAGSGSAGSAPGARKAEEKGKTSVGRLVWETFSEHAKGKTTSPRRGGLTSGTTGQDLLRSLVHEADSGLGRHLRKPDDHCLGWDAWASSPAWMPACRASPERECRGWVNPWAEWLPVGRQSGDCSEAAGGLGHRLNAWSPAGRDLLVALLQVLLLDPALLPGLREGPWRRKDPRMELGWSTAAGRFGLLDWRPRVSLSGAFCRVCPAGCSASDNASKKVILA